jgi:hypothetical protein
MSHTPAAPAAPSSKAEVRAVAPSWIDYMLILLGVGLSLLFTQWLGLANTRRTDTPAWVTEEVIRILPTLVLLPSGIILWWPAFFLTGRVRGRPADLTWAEWLWGLVWLADLALVGGIAWYRFQGLPGFLSRSDLEDTVYPMIRLIMLAAAGVALLLALATAVRGSPVPWTHHFGLALLLWPALPLLLIWLGHLGYHLKPH